MRFFGDTPEEFLRDFFSKSADSGDLEFSIRENEKNDLRLMTAHLLRTNLFIRVRRLVTYLKQKAGNQASSQSDLATKSTKFSNRPRSDFSDTHKN